ncbi:MAG: hypothetical protein LBD14_02350 [Puniceicoccales bacterium]|jgi:hypothetical protein|nr:hypothetical protein [Puniceicoccales bacterium]
MGTLICSLLRESVPALDRFPRIMLRRAKARLFRREPTDGRGVKENFRADQRRETHRPAASMRFGGVINASFSIKECRKVYSA